MKSAKTYVLIAILGFYSKAMRRVSSSRIGNLLLTNTKIMLISILSREVTKIFVIGIQNKINLNKKYAKEKKDVA